MVRGILIRVSAKGAVVVLTSLVYLSVGIEGVEDESMSPCICGQRTSRLSRPFDLVRVPQVKMLVSNLVL